MLAAFNELGYSAEWQVINAAEYGRSQRRRRVFFFVFRNDTSFAKKMDFEIENSNPENLFENHLYDEYIFKKGLFARQFPVMPTPNKNRYEYYNLSDDIVEISDNFTG